MKSKIAALIAGIIFALGLGVSGMTQPHKVIGFLDLTGAWDPSLLFVMIGAITTHAVLLPIFRRRTTPLFSEQWALPQKTRITKSLITGAILFGLGWGLSGYCPGPAVVSLASFQSRPLMFVVSMIVGMLVFRFLNRRFNFDR